MRMEADWMSRPADDQILEALREHGALTPKTMGEHTGLTNNYAGERARELSRYGLVNRVARGVYTISGDGRAWLDEDLDATTLRPDDE